MTAAAQHIDILEHQSKFGRFVSGGSAVGQPKLTKFREEVLERVEKIPQCEVVTYADIGGRKLAQVGRAIVYLVSHCDPKLVWYRVVKEDGSLLFGNAAEEQRGRLEAEGVEFLDNGKVDLDLYRCNVPPFEPIG